MNAKAYIFTSYVELMVQTLKIQFILCIWLHSWRKQTKVILYSNFFISLAKRTLNTINTSVLFKYVDDVFTTHNILNNIFKSLQGDLKHKHKVTCLLCSVLHWILIIFQKWIVLVSLPTRTHFSCFQPVPGAFPPKGFVRPRVYTLISIFPEQN